MKIRHRVPPAIPRSVTVDDDYEAEVQQTVRRAEAKWRAAVKAVERAEQRLRRLESKASRTADTRAVLDRARMDLVHRYDELRELEELMQKTPGAQPTGRGTVRNPLPKGSKL